MSYTINGVGMPGVTDLLSQVGSPDGLMVYAAKKNAEFIKNELKKLSILSIDQINEIVDKSINAYKDHSSEARDMGTDLHNLLDLYIQGKNVDIKDYNEYIQKSFLEFVRWDRENVKEWIDNEMTVYSEHFLYAGRLDAVVRLKDGKVYIIDFKTGHVNDNYKKQLAAYKHAIEEKKTVDEIIINLDRNNEIFKSTQKVKNYDIDGLLVLQFQKDSEKILKIHDYTKHYEHSINSFLKLLDWFYADKKRRLKNNYRVEEY